MNFCLQVNKQDLIGNSALHIACENQQVTVCHSMVLRNSNTIFQLVMEMNTFLCIPSALSLFSALLRYDLVFNIIRQCTYYFTILQIPRLH